MPDPLPPEELVSALQSLVDMFRSEGAMDHENGHIAAAKMRERRADEITQAADTIERLEARVAEAREALKPFKTVIIKAPADATDNDFAAVRFRDLRKASQWLKQEDGG